jgi:hypothetical protein
MRQRTGKPGHRPPLTRPQRVHVLLGALEDELRQYVREIPEDYKHVVGHRLRQVQAWAREYEDMGLVVPGYVDED